MELDYESAIKKIARLEDKATLDVELNVFDRSLIIAVLFGVDKNKAYYDIIDIRMKDMRAKKNG